MIASDQAVVLEDVSKRYATREVSASPGERRRVREVDALSHVSIAARRGEALGVVGPNGSGKTTLLRLVAGVTRPSAGTVSVRGRVLALLGPSAAFHMDLSARENVRLGAAFQGVARRTAAGLVDGVLDDAGLREAADVPAKHLSDGMRFRLAFSLALALPHEVLLCDEAFAPADAAYRERAFRRVRERVASGLAVLLASHEAFVVEALADRTARLDGGRLGP